MRVTQERLDSNLRVTRVKTHIHRAVVSAVEEVDGLTDAELVEAISLVLSENLTRSRQRETKPYHHN